jgi:hypothetical protein
LAVVSGTVKWLNMTNEPYAAGEPPDYNILLDGDDGNDYFDHHHHLDGVL